MDFQILKSDCYAETASYTLGIKSDVGIITLPDYNIVLWDDKSLVEYNFAEIDNLGYTNERVYDIDFPEQFILDLEDNKEECSYNSGKWDFKINKDKVIITKYEFDEFIIKIELKRTSGIMTSILNFMKDIKKNMIAMMNYNAIEYIDSYDRFLDDQIKDVNKELDGFNDFKYACSEYKELYANLKQKKIK